MVGSKYNCYTFRTSHLRQDDLGSQSMRGFISKHIVFFGFDGQPGIHNLFVNSHIEFPVARLLGGKSRSCFTEVVGGSQKYEQSFGFFYVPKMDTRGNLQFYTFRQPNSPQKTSNLNRIGQMGRQRKPQQISAARFFCP